MKSSKNFYRKIREKYFLSNPSMIEDAKEVLPFFAMITVALIWLFIVYVQRIDLIFHKVIFAALMLLHLVLYWAVFKFIDNPHGLRWYFIFQALLAFVITFFAADYGLVIGLYASLIGNAMGALRRSKDLLLFLPGFFLLAILSVILLGGISQLGQWSIIAIPSALFSGFIAYMFRRQLEMRNKAERLLADLQAAHSQLEDYAKQVQSLTLIQERQRIARELHDTLAQELTGVVLQLEAVSTHIEKDNPARAQEILQGAMRQSRYTLSEARKVIDDLRISEAASPSLEAAIRQEITRFEALTQLRCEATFDLLHPIPDEARQHVLKLITEGLNNIAKHADAGHAWLHLNEEINTLLIEIGDNGIGFDKKEEIGKPGHYGLIGIRERVELLNGSLFIDSHPGTGTKLVIHIPLDAKGVQNEN